MQYVVHAPAGERPLSGWPLLCFLHGLDEAAPLPVMTAVTRHGPLAATASPIAREQFIIVAPQLPSPGDQWRLFAAEVAYIVDAASEGSGGDRSRRFLTGFSFGGNGVFDLALAQPDRWRALWAVDPTRVPMDPGLPVWLSVGSIARRRASEFSLALSAGSDPNDDRVVRDEGEDHVGAARRAYADTHIYEWLRARH